MPRTNPLSQVLTIAEASHRFKLSDGYLRYLLARKLVRGRKASGTWLVDPASITQFVHRYRSQSKRGRKPRPSKQSS